MPSQAPSMIAPSNDDAFASATARAAVSGWTGGRPSGLRIRERSEAPSAASIDRRARAA